MKLSDYPGSMQGFFQETDYQTIKFTNQYGQEIEIVLNESRITLANRREGGGNDEVAYPYSGRIIAIWNLSSYDYDTKEYGNQTVSEFFESCGWSPSEHVKTPNDELIAIYIEGFSSLNNPSTVLYLHEIMEHQIA
jgi:hypothetical protein